MLYDVLLIDPPWQYKLYSEKTRTFGRRASHHYKIQDWQWCGSLGPHLRSVMARNCAVFVWVTPALLPWQIATCTDGFTGERMNGQKTGPFPGWGLRYITEVFDWIKLTKTGKPAFGMGHWTRMGKESVLLFTTGSPKRVNRGTRQVIFAEQQREHSRKPDHIHRAIEQLMGPDMRKLEVFGRRYMDGWTVIGDELDGLDITDSLRYVKMDYILPRRVVL